MNGFWYTLLVRVANLGGSWIFVLVSRIIASGYFVLSRRVPESRRFYAALFPERGHLYHLYMGMKEKEGVERLQKDQLRRSGITIIAADKENSSPFTAVAGIRFLQSGGLVSMAGDIVWRSDQRKVHVTFLGHDAYLPEAPFIFALVAGAPLLVFFVFRTGESSYHFTLSEPIAIQPTSRQARPAAIARAAQQYADLLEQSLRRHPFEWYHFDRFIH